MYSALKEDSRKGDFYQLVQKDLKDLNIEMTDSDIKNHKKSQWEMYVKEQVKNAAFLFLVMENSSKTKTKYIQFSELKMSDYLFENRNKILSEIIFSVRSQTLDIKVWNEWKYNDGICVMCNKEIEDMDHFVNCVQYEKKNVMELFGKILLKAMLKNNMK